MGAIGTYAPSDCGTNSAGRVTFTYAGALVGKDTITAVITARRPCTAAGRAGC